VTDSPFRHIDDIPSRPRPVPDGPSRHAAEEPPRHVAEPKTAPIRRESVPIGSAGETRPARRSAPAAGVGTLTHPAHPVPRRSTRELVEQAHADVAEELPVRRPNQLIGQGGRKGPAERAASGWFRVRNTAGQPRRVSLSAELTDVPEPQNWLSAADEGWSIVETISRTERYTYTEDGLPVRERGAHLLPGSAAASAAGPQQPIERDPVRTRSRLSGFQQGIRKAKETDGRSQPKKSGGWKSLGKRK